MVVEAWQIGLVKQMPRYSVCFSKGSILSIRLNSRKVGWLKTKLLLSSSSSSSFNQPDKRLIIYPCICLCMCGWAQANELPTTATRDAAFVAKTLPTFWMQANAETTQKTIANESLEKAVERRYADAEWKHLYCQPMHNHSVCVCMYFRDTYRKWPLWQAVHLPHVILVLATMRRQQKSSNPRLSVGPTFVHRLSEGSAL